MFITPTSQRQCASNAPHVCSRSVGVFLFALKWLHAPPHKSDYQLAGGKRADIVRVGDRGGVVARLADVAPSLIGIALMLDCNDAIVVGLDEPVSGIGFVSCGLLAASGEKPSHNNGGDKDLHAIIVSMQPRLVHGRRQPDTQTTSPARVESGKLTSREQTKRPSRLDRRTSMQVWDHS